ncbi:hypothetical protein [Chlorobaculum thiosulfatiphilum]|jgi:hypothetical protein|uniref:hypothetical protein n=1 Tax=Chlorobaculum thiosulfatiphilum TaxID=115852 RepID=UPI001476C2A9|nr:hypothetical protein [Chlorobaculum thiosulfatiphilum]
MRWILQDGEMDNRRRAVRKPEPAEQSATRIILIGKMPEQLGKWHDSEQKYQNHGKNSHDGIDDQKRRNTCQRKLDQKNHHGTERHFDVGNDDIPVLSGIVSHGNGIFFSMMVI